MRPYMVRQKRCVWNKTFLLGNTLKFWHHFCICPLAVAPRKASNETSFGVFDQVMVQFQSVPQFTKRNPTINHAQNKKEERHKR